MKAIVKKMIANLHAKPSLTSELIDEVQYGMTVEIIEETNHAWVYVKTFYQYEGYCEKDSLLIDDEKAESWLEDASFVIIQNFADVLCEPKIQTAKLATLVKGSIVRYLGPSEGSQEWAQIQLVTGQIGYTRTQWIQRRLTQNILPEQQFREKVVQTALSYLSTPYRWGGKTPLGIDCSGLCSMAYLLNGVVIYRDAKIVDGFPIKQIPFEQIQKGDLIYFPGHIAMYMGEDLYVHSSLGGNQVSINSLNKEHSHYRKDLATTIIAVGSLFG